MPTSDSEDFESADEGHSSPDKNYRKKRLSSSNYSDKALETEKPLNTCSTTGKEQTCTKNTAVADGWDDFDIDESEAISTNQVSKSNQENATKSNNHSTSTKVNKTSEDTGWDDFDDWGQDDNSKVQTAELSRIDDKNVQQEADKKEVTNKQAPTSTTSGWGWGWSVDSLLSTATAGITNITSQVSQGISTVLETGIGAPDPEELARRKLKESENAPKAPNLDRVSTEVEDKQVEDQATGDAFQFGNLLSGVTKFVESTSTKVISGGLDTLETIGKKTMEVLQDGDPGLAKKRAMLGLGAEDKPVLSQLLREAKAKADEEDKIKEEKREAKEVHYETLFDDFEGLVHLEALEMLSKQVNMRIEERLRGVEPEKRQDMKETLQQVAELCEMPEEEEEDDEPLSEDTSKADAFLERLQTATQDLGLKLQFQPIVKQYKEILDSIAQDTDATMKGIYKRAVSALAEATALSVEQYHKAAEMLLVKSRRSTADEADALTQMTVVLTKHISEIASLYTEKLNSLASDNKEQINNYITNIFLEAGNSSTYIQNAFQLALPILQIGAV